MPKNNSLYHPPTWIPFGQLLFELTWLLLARWTPKPFKPLRLLVLRLFGCKITGSPFVHQRARITHPWNLTLCPCACLGDRAAAYALGPITLGEGSTIAQEAYLCTGTHDLGDPSLPLITAPIIVEDNVFVGARAFILPGVTLGAHSVIGACSVVTKSVPAHTTVAGNPAKPISKV